MDEITQEQKEVVEELKRRTIEDVTPKMLEDVSLFYRFAKAREFNLEQAESMLRKHIEWRKEYEIDSILIDYEPPEVFVKYVASTFICFDKEGCLLRYSDAGRIDIKGLLNITTKKELVKYISYVLEQDKENMIQQSRNLGKPMYSAIYNFEDLSYVNAISVKFLQFGIFFLKTFFDNYPETIRRVIVINAPAFFPWLFDTAKPIIPDSITQKLGIYDTDKWKEYLLEFTDADSLPACLGGNKTDPDGNPLCTTIINWGRPIPKGYLLNKKGKKLSLKADVEKLVIPPFSKEEINIEIKEDNSHLEWEFETKNRDISFSLLFRGQTSEKLEPVELIPQQRINTQSESKKGSFKCEKIGIYTIVFDNSFSWIRSKEVYFRTELHGPRNDDL